MDLILARNSPQALLKFRQALLEQKNSDGGIIYVYKLMNEDQQRFKIGYTKRMLNKRMREWNDHHQLHCVAHYHFERNVHYAERLIHKALAYCRTYKIDAKTNRKQVEWFCAHLQDIQIVILSIKKMLEWLLIALLVAYAIAIVFATFFVRCIECGNIYLARNSFRRIGRELKPLMAHSKRVGNEAMLYVKFPLFIAHECPRCNSITESESWIDSSEWEEGGNWFEVRDCPMCGAKGKLSVHVDKGFLESDPFRNTSGSARCGFCQGKSWVPVEKIKSLTIV